MTVMFSDVVYFPTRFDASFTLLPMRLVPRKRMVVGFVYIELIKPTLIIPNLLQMVIGYKCGSVGRPCSQTHLWQRGKHMFAKFPLAPSCNTMTQSARIYF